jgi:hypothetical protein
MTDTKDTIRLDILSEFVSAHRTTSFYIAEAPKQKPTDTPCFYGRTLREALDSAIEHRLLTSG